MFLLWLEGREPLMALMVVCRSPECRDGVEQRPLDPKPLVKTGETYSAWTFRCATCGSLRVVTKDQIGGTIGAGKTDEQRGKGLTRYTHGMQFHR